MPPRARAQVDPSDSADPVLTTELDDILGHDLIKDLLGRMLEETRFPQALLFSGPALLGKRSLAVVVAKRLLSSGSEPAVMEEESLFGIEESASVQARPAEALRCDPAVSRRVARGAHLDLAVVQPLGASKVIRIEQVRQLQDWAWISPSEGPAKVALVFGADTISEEAANSFLKLLEEPPPKLTLILVSDLPHRLLETVRSRCTPFPFHPIPSARLEAWLRDCHGADADRARLVAGLSEGRPGLAMELLAEESLVVRRPLLGELEVLLTHGFLALPGVAARALRHAGGLKPALEGFLLLLRDALILAGHGPEGDSILEADLREPMERTLGGLSREAVLSAAESVARGLDITRHLYIPSEPLVLENVLADVGKALRKTG